MLHSHIKAFVVSLAGIAAAVVAGTIINPVSSLWAYIVAVAGLCLLFGFWAWKLPLRQRGRGIVTVLTLLVVIAASPFYAGWFLRDTGPITVAGTLNGPDEIGVYWGKNVPSHLWAQTSIAQLEQPSGAALTINAQDIFYLHVVDGHLYIDAPLFTGFQAQASDAFNTPVTVKNNRLSGAPQGWKVRQNGTTLVVWDNYGVPVLSLKYDAPSQITVSGLFPTKLGLCEVDINPDTTFLFAETSSQLQTYTLDREFGNPLMALIQPAETYNLAAIYGAGK